MKPRHNPTATGRKSASESKRSEPTLETETESAQPKEEIRLLPVRMKLQKLLVPVDFSPQSQKALQYAIAFGQQFDATLVLLYVVEPAVYPTEIGYVPTERESMHSAMAESS